VNESSTICAVSTPAGRGGVAIVRISGPDAFTVCDRIYRPAKKNRSVTKQAARTISFGKIVRDEEVIDEVLVSVFRTPHSYTGEDTVEIACHGSVFIQQEILKLLLRNGCKMAAPGEFTQRAYLNGKLDLSQAEAVGDLIASSSAATHKIAMQQMRGDFSNLLANLRDELLRFVTLLELELDFSEEDVEFADRKELSELAEKIEYTISKLTDSFATGNAIKNGIPVAIVGATNAGKSTLLNRLLKEDRAIVSELHGTTRDSIEDAIIIQGILFRFIDTAGIRETKDSIEQLGIRRTFEKIEQASVVLWVTDLSDSSSTTSFDAIFRKRHFPEKDRKLILILNKADKLSPEELASKQQFFRTLHPDQITISAKSGEGIDLLEQKLLACIPQISENDVIVSSMRHYESLTEALRAIQRVREGLSGNISGDLLTQDVRDCLSFLGNITGRQIHSEEVLQNIFKNFCVGK
jgi:tRNA modification GTPase